MKINGHELVSGDTEITVHGKRGRYTYQGTSQTTAGRTVLTLVGPIHSGHEAFHACYVEDVKTVHRTWQKRPSTSAR